MVDSKNNKVNLFTNAGKDKSINKNIVKTYPSLEEQVYKIIKNKIIWHEIKPRERIIDKKLAEESYFEHYEIFKAIKEKKSQLAAKLMAKHIDNAKQIILDNSKFYSYG